MIPFSSASYVTSRMNSWGNSKPGEEGHFLEAVSALSSSFSNRICIIEQYLLAATVDAEEAETTFLFSLLVFLRLLWCVPRRMAAFFFMALLLFFPDPSQCLNKATKSLIFRFYSWLAWLLGEPSRGGHSQQYFSPMKFCVHFLNTVFFWSIQEAKTNAVVSERA